MNAIFSMMRKIKDDHDVTTYVSPILFLSHLSYRLRIQRAAQSDSGNYSCNDVFFFSLYLNQVSHIKCVCYFYSQVYPQLPNRRVFSSML